MAHRAVANLACTSHPLFAVLAVAARILMPSVMQCPPVAVAAVVPLVQPSAVLLVRISPFVLQIAVAPVVVLVNSSVPMIVLLPLLAVFQAPQLERLVLHLQILQPVLPVRQPGSVVFGTGFLFQQ